MIKTFTALAAAGAIALMTALAPQPAAARNQGGAIAAGLIGGIAAGALIAGAANANNPPPPPAYAPAPAYYPPPGPPHGEDCYYERPRYFDNYSGTWRRGPRHLVCD
jgi:hypothetical protein